MDSRSPSTPEPDSPVRVLPARHPWRSLASMLGVIVILVIVWALITNPRWQWGVVAQWFTAASIMRGLGLTLSLTAIAGVAGFVLGFALALLRMSSSPVLAGLAWTYIWIFRSVPLLVQLLLWYNIGYLYETLVLGIPFTDVVLFEASTTELVGKFAAAALGLGALVKAFPQAFRLIAVVGALYVAWLGLKALHGAFKTAADPQHIVVRRGRSAFVDGFAVQIANPKAVLFFTAVLPPFLDVNRPVVPQLVLFAAAVIGMDMMSMSAYALSGAALSRRMGQPRFRRGFGLFVGILLLAAAVLIVVRL